MKKIICLLVLLAISAIAYCQDQPLQLTIKSDKEVYEVGDEIVLTLTWKNLSNKDVLISFREDMLLQGMLSFKGEGDKGLLSRMIMIEFAPIYKPKIPAGDSYSHRLKGKLFRENLKEPYLIEHQKFFGNLILRFGTKTLSEIPILLGKSGKFYITFQYKMSADSYLAKNEPDTWTGEVTSNTIQIEVVGKKGILKEEALKIAEEVCRKEGWELVDTFIYEEGNHWHFRTNHHRLGGNAIILIDKKTGKVLEKGYSRE